MLLLGLTFLVGLLLPSLESARDSARSIKTQVHLQRIWQAMSLYAIENGGQYPEAGADFTARLQPYLDADPAVWIPTRGNGAAGQSTFIIVGEYPVESGVGVEEHSPSRRVVIIENPALAGRRINVLLADGEVAQMRRDEIDHRLRTAPRLHTQTGEPWHAPTSRVQPPSP
jgi:hypothetical protein